MDRTGTDPGPMTPIVLPLADDSPAALPRPEPADLVHALVERARGGDLHAWSRLYQDTFDPVFRHVCYLTGDPVVSEDLVQDAYARAMTAVTQYDGRASFVTWLRGIALNVVRMHWRRTVTRDRVHSHLRHLVAVAQGHAQGIDRAHLQDQRMRLVYEILATLPESLREAFILRELEGLSTHDAGAQLGISAGNVAVRASRARSRIRKELSRLGWLGGEA